MSKVMKSFFLVVLAVFISSGTPCQDDNKEKGKQVLNRYLEKIGGRTLVREVRTIKTTGEVITADKKLDCIIAIKFPDKILTQIKGEEYFYCSRYNSGLCEALENQKKITVQESDLFQYKKDAYIFPQAYDDLLQYTITYVKRYKEDSLTFDIIRFDYSNGLSDLLFFDTSSGFLHKIINHADASIYFRDFKRFDGILFPTECEFVFENSFRYTSRYEKVKFNSEIDDKIFVIK
jgi:hypothetical protein